MKVQNIDFFIDESESHIALLLFNIYMIQYINIVLNVQ